jgi:hypothetical protein
MLFWCWPRRFQLVENAPQRPHARRQWEAIGGDCRLQQRDKRGFLSIGKV